MRPPRFQAHWVIGTVKVATTATRTASTAMCRMHGIRTCEFALSQAFASRPVNSGDNYRAGYLRAASTTSCPGRKDS
jgi:hypothetical protein